MNIRALFLKPHYLQKNNCGMVLILQRCDIFQYSQYFRLYVVPNENNFRNIFSDSNQSNSAPHLKKRLPVVLFKP